jgi:hypothetical protein
MISYQVTITELLAMHGHLVDGGHLDRLGEVFTADVVYDVSRAHPRPRRPAGRR